MNAGHEVVELLGRLIRCRTEDPPGREIELARIVREALAGDGIEAELDEFAPGRANVLGRVRGRGERPALVFSAHLDTMPSGDEGAWTHAPFAAEVVDGRMYGRGTADMKGGLAAMMVAARRLAASDGALAGDLLLAFSAGESSNCIGARRFVETGALAGANAILVSEPSGLRALSAETGALWLRLTTTGAPGHASGAGAGVGRGVNAIEAMVDVLASLRRVVLPGAEHPLLGLPSVSVGTVHGGGAVNLTPDRAEAEIDIRYLPGTPREALLDAVRSAVGDEVAVAVIDDKPPVEAPADHPFVAASLAALAAVRGENQAPGGVSYFSDSNVLCPALGIPRVIIGPGALGMSGQRDEYVAIDDLVAAVDVFEDLARRWLA